MAVRLRKQGKSLPYVHTKLGIPKSTLSYWFKARKSAVKWHNEQKQNRLKIAKEQAFNTLARIDTKER